MTRAAPTMQRETAQRIVQFIAANPGASLLQIARACCRSESVVAEYLTVARAAGLVDFLRIANVGIRWWPAADIPAQREAQAQRKLEQRRTRQKVCKAWLRERRASVAALGSEDLADMPIRRWAAASDPLPFRCTAPASVFHLGASL